MSSAGYDALKNYLERWCRRCGGSGDLPLFAGASCPECNGTGRIADTSAPVCRTHYFNPADDRDALIRQAEEGAHLLGMGGVCRDCDGNGTITRSLPSQGGSTGSTTTGCSTCRTGWLNDSDTPAIDRLSLCDVLVKRPRCGGDSCVYLRRYEDCPDCQSSYALPTSPCETCDGHGWTPHRAFRRVPDCTDCDGTGRKPIHEHQPPGDWDREARDVRGSGVRGQRNYDPRNSREVFDREDLTDYQCGDHPGPGDGEAWHDRILFHEVIPRRDAFGHEYDLELRSGRIVHRVGSDPLRSRSRRKRVEAAREAIRRSY